MLVWDQSQQFRAASFSSRKGAFVEWSDRGGLTRAGILDEHGCGLTVEMNADARTIRAGELKNAMRVGLWVEIPATGHVTIAEHRLGNPEGLFARRGASRIDFVGFQDSEGNFTDHTAEYIANPSSVPAMAAVTLTAEGLPLHQTGHEGTWGVEWHDARPVAIRIMAHDAVVEVPVASVWDGVVRVIDCVRGSAEVVDPSTSDGAG